MFIVLLKFSDNKSSAPEHMEAHNSWIQQGFADGVFLLAGSLQPGMGGSVVAHNIHREALEQRVGMDPFVKENIVKAEILEIEPKKVDERLRFLDENVS
ncbi:MAG: hypothetical protein KTR18_04905 [Acidiferrobacterales bacterium]|nr:hypothetical protein [Acidiferrobacterales bacterium]